MMNLFFEMENDFRTSIQEGENETQMMLEAVRAIDIAICSGRIVVREMKGTRGEYVYAFDSKTGDSMVALARNYYLFYSTCLAKTLYWKALRSLGRASREILELLHELEVNSREDARTCVLRRRGQCN